MITETINLMGLPAKDKVTGLEGVITSVSFDLFGCVQVTMSPKAKKDGEVVIGYWMDVNRIEVGKTAKSLRVMPVPDFDKVAEPAKYQRGAAPKRAK